MAQERSAARALRLLETGCYSPASLDAVMADAEGECTETRVAQMLDAARMRYSIHEQSIVGVRHGSEEHQAWVAERKQIFHELRGALMRALERETA